MTERDTELMYAGILEWRREQSQARAEKQKANQPLPPRHSRRRARRKANHGGRCGRPLKRPGARVMTPEEKETWGRDSIGLRNFRRNFGLCYACGVDAGGELSCPECRADQAARNREEYQRQRVQRRRSAC